MCVRADGVGGAGDSGGRGIIRIYGVNLQSCKGD